MSDDLFTRLKRDAADEWQAYTAHAFVEGMRDASLPLECFRHYLVQDYLFLIQFARAYALGVTKADTLADMRACASALSAIIDVEMNLHVGLCARWDITPEQLENAEEARATIAYTRYVLDAGHRGDLLDLLCALSPCVIGYGEIGKRLLADTTLDAENPYRVWIDEYGGEVYQQVAEEARAMLARLGRRYLTPQRYPRLLELFKKATRLEADFWEMGMTLAD